MRLSPGTSFACLPYLVQTDAIWDSFISRWFGKKAHYSRHTKGRFPHREDSLRVHKAHTDVAASDICIMWYGSKGRQAHLTGLGPTRYLKT